MSPSFVIYDENTFQENIKSTYENSLSSEVGHIILLRLLCYSWSERCKWNFLGKFNSTMKIQIEFENTEDLARMTEWEKRKHSTFLTPMNWQDVHCGGVGGAEAPAGLDCAHCQGGAMWAARSSFQHKLQILKHFGQRNIVTSKDLSGGNMTDFSVFTVFDYQSSQSLWLSLILDFDLNQEGSDWLSELSGVWGKGKYLWSWPREGFESTSQTEAPLIKVRFRSLSVFLSVL